LDIFLVFKSANLAKSITEYLGIIESISQKIERLAKSEFEAGIRSLEQAQRSNKEQETLLREARACFNKAISLEKDERLALSYLGLALCHFFLKDYDNSEQALRDLLNIDIDIALEMSLLIQGNTFTVIPAFIGIKFKESRIKNLRKLKEEVKTILESEF
jgi:tetratricopeptide (TPR) repeat protein